MAKAINICFSTDKFQAYPATVAIHSILTNLDHSRELQFNILVESKETKIFILDQMSRLRGFHPQAIFKTDVQFIPEKENAFFVKHMRVIHKDERNKESIASMMNFGRFSLPDVFQSVEKTIFLDADVIVQDDISKLYDIGMDGNPLAARPRKLFDNAYVKSFSNYDPNYRGFNAGVCVVDFRDWRQRSLFDQVKEIMISHKRDEEGLFLLGTQPIMNILYYQNYMPLADHWNLYELGWSRATLKDSIIAQSKILHWSGVHKPWLPDGNYKDLWEKYRF